MSNTSNDFSPLGTDLFGEPIRQETDSPVAGKFIIPPFSVLNSREGSWQERKRGWSSMGIESELGRDAPVIHCPNSSSDQPLKDDNYTSIFDPVLCELMYSWFTAPGWSVVDPFAGGSVRGIVAGALGRRYWGGELRGDQVRANRRQAAEIPVSVTPQWVEGDSAETMMSAPAADFVFSCPPYGDLEVYSDDPADLSTMEYHTFIAAYKRIILRACSRLKDNRFAAFVVGDYRDKRGFYRDFVSETIKGFTNAGLHLYNEGILVTSVGSASMRVTKQFTASRKFAKTHQNVLVFIKGDPRKAVAEMDAASGQ